ncbi:MAG: sigma-70 family RNA polymerase sigma factor, partial [Clostridia bacterium]|nr:sigma-70 family RNA polymerase sigma factor [Clostridia bacterium]
MVKLLIKKILAFLGINVGERVDYISASNNLPSPLSQEEETETVERFLSGDKEARLKLIEHNLRLVVYIAKRFDNTGIDMDDLVSIGTIGLIKAVGSYNPSKNIKLATFASRCIENEILMYLRKTSRTRSEMSLDE